MRSEHTLYIVATPIGHRDDLSPRAIETLRGVTRIYAEDTRHSLPLMRHHGIETRLHALHEHNEVAEAARIVEHVGSVGSAALITDAGTPLISDPGFRVVRACRRAGVRVSPVPGPCAVSAALSVGGLPTDRFQFVGFPPSRSAARRNWLAMLADVPHTLVLYESPHRIADSLADLGAVFGATREMTLARELTKRHETLSHGTVAEVLERVRADPDQRRGEFVLMVAGTAWRGESVTATGGVTGVGPGAAGEAGTGDASIGTPRGLPVATVDDGVTGVRGMARDAVGVGADDESGADGSAEGGTALAVGGGGAPALDRVLDVLLGHLPPKDVARCAAELCGVSRRVAYDRALERRGRGPNRR